MRQRIDIPPQTEKPMAENRDGDAPQKMCAYGAQEAKLAGQKCSDLTGASCSTETKREAQRVLTSEFGHDAPPAGVAAPAEQDYEIPNEGHAVRLTATRVPRTDVTCVLPSLITRAVGREFLGGVVTCLDSRSGTADSGNNAKDACPLTSATPAREDDRVQIFDEVLA